MDYYVVIMCSTTLETPMVKWSLERLGCLESQSLLPVPNVESILRHRKARFYEARFKISDNDTDMNGTVTSSWNAIGSVEDEIMEKQSCAIASSKAAADSILALTNVLPVVGSYILYIVWDIRDLNPTEERCLPLIGVAKKLCCWHGGKLIIYTGENEPDPETNLVLNFIDDCAETISGGNLLELSNRTFWHGNLELVTEDGPLCTISGFSLSLFENSTKLLQCCLNSNQLGSIFEQKTEFDCIWFSRKINILSFVNVSEIPIFYYTGKKFILQHHCNKNCLGSEGKISRMCTKMTFLRSNAFLCSLNYSLIKNRPKTFEAPQDSNENWRNKILKHHDSIFDTACKPPKDIKMLPLFVRQSESDHQATVASGGKSTLFTAHVLFSPHDLSANYPTLLDDLTISTSPLTRNEESKKLDDLRRLNPHGLLRECEAFGTSVRKGVMEWLKETKASVITAQKLEHMVNEALESSAGKDFSILLNCPNLSKGSTPPTPCFQSLGTPCERFKQAIWEITKPESPNIPTGTTNNGLCSPSPRILDMHVTPQDILHCFSLSGQPHHVLSISHQNPCITPNLEILQDFDQALKMTYHGIMYNIEGRESERIDRKCRRLVEQQVKFETCSIASEGKVPSPATINIYDSPIKKSINAHRNRKILQPNMIMENFRERKINMRKRPASSDTLTSTKMVLRSTPKKSKSNTKSAQEPLTTVTLADLRQKRKTYVQDNKKRLQDIIHQTLVDYNIQENSKEFSDYSRTLYDVSMTFLKTLKSSKDLDRVMRETVAKNVRLVMSFSLK